MSYAAGVLLLVAAVAVIIGAVVQVLLFRRGQQIITRGQLVMRLVTAALLVFTIGLIFLGVLYPWPTALAELGFWTVLTCLAAVVIFLAANDLRQVERQKHLRQADLYRGLQPGAKPRPPEGKDPR
jgi:hypothetical protein